MEKKGVGKEGDLEETREKLEKKRREGEKREIEWMFSRGCGKGYVCAGRSVWRSGDHKGKEKGKEEGKEEEAKREINEEKNRREERGKNEGLRYIWMREGWV